MPAVAALEFVVTRGDGRPGLDVREGEFEQVYSVDDMYGSAGTAGTAGGGGGGIGGGGTGGIAGTGGAKRAARGAGANSRLLVVALWSSGRRDCVQAFTAARGDDLRVDDAVEAQRAVATIS